MIKRFYVPLSWLCAILGVLASSGVSDEGSGSASVRMWVLTSHAVRISAYPSFPVHSSLLWSH